jgi:hypothetical protein
MSPTKATSNDTNSGAKDLETYCNSAEFQRFLERQLEFIDENLSKSEQAVHARPILASMLFVENCIIGPDDKPPPGYLEHAWFGRICELTTRWYRKRFGRELLESPKAITAAVVSFFGTVFPVSVPSFPTVPGEETGTSVVFFAKEVLSHEEPLDWIVPRPDLSGLSNEVAEDVRNRVRTICNLTRKIEWGLSFALLGPGQLSDQCASIQGHFEKGVADICAGRRGAAIWDFHLAVEISLKLFLAQRGVSPIPHTHDLADLMQRASENGLPSTCHIKVNVVPSHTDAIKHRYSAIPQPPLHKTIEIYETALQLVGHVADALDHHDIALREVVYLKALPWHPSRKQTSKSQTT